jgi:hypothetical protein
MLAAKNAKYAREETDSELGVLGAMAPIKFRTPVDAKS